MAARLIQRASRLLAVPVSFQPLPTFVPSECVRIAQLAPSFPCQAAAAAALHTSPLCRLADSLPEVTPTLSTRDDEEFYTMLKDVPEMDELLDIASEKSLNGNRSVMVLQQVARRTNGKSDQILNDPRLQELLKNVNKNIEHIWNIRLIKLLQCLYVLGLSNNNYSVQSTEIEVRWRLRRLSIGTLSYLSSFITPDPMHQDKKCLFNDLVKEVELRWTEIKDVRTLVTLASKLGPSSDSLMEKLEDKILEYADRFTPEASRQLISQLAAQSRRKLSVLHALSFHLVQSKSELSPQVIVDLASAYAKLKFCNPQVLQKMATDILPKLPEAKPFEMALIIRAYSSLRIPNAPLCEAIAQECMKRRESFTNSSLCTVLLSFARLNFQPLPNEEFFNVIHQWLDSEFDSLTWYQQLETVWSLCVLSHVTLAYLQKILEPQFYNQVLEDSSVRSSSVCKKLLQINATALLESPGYQAPLLPIDVLKALQQKTQLTVASALKTGAIDVLKAIFPVSGTCKFSEATIYGSYLDGEVVLDSELKAVPIKDFWGPHNLQGGRSQPLPEGLKRIAIVTLEFAQHMFRGKDLLGQYRMNRRHLQAAGFLVVEVPYYEWQEMKSDWQKQYFLREQIKKVVAMEDSGL